jgi:hypothetical protein
MTTTTNESEAKTFDFIVNRAKQLYPHDNTLAGAAIQTGDLSREAG